MSDIENMITPILNFLHCRTPKEWVDAALKNLAIILIDHGANELKAAQAAMTLISRNPLSLDILNKMSRLAREELLHFEQVLKILKKRGIDYKPLKASGYAYKMAKHVRPDNKGKLVDSLIIGSIIEARSCERFECISSHLDEELEKFYLSLLKSESRHFQDYLDLAQKYSEEPIEERIQFFLSIEKDSILQPDDLLRLHSGMPTDNLKIY